MTAPARTPSVLCSTRSLSVQYQPVGTLLPSNANARTHSKQQIRQIAESIRTFGFTNPVLIDASARLLPDIVELPRQSSWGCWKCRRYGWRT